MRNLLYTISVAVAVLCGNLCAGLSVVTAHASGTNYRLMPGDRVQVTVFGQDQMSGKFQLDTAGQIEVPVVGPISVGTLTLEEVKRRLESALAKGILKNPSVSVSIDEYRPVYVHGYVKSPGVYPFRPNMSALGAMVVAGGAPRYEAAAMLASAEVINAEERVDVLLSKRLRLLIRLQGLEAQHKDQSAIDAASFPPGVSSLPQFEQMLENERRRMEIDVDALKSELEVLQRQRPMLRAENDSILMQIKSQAKQIQIMQSRISEIDPLVKKGLGRQQSLMDLNMQASIQEQTLARLQATKTRNDLEISNAELKIKEKVNAYKQRIVLQQSDVQYELSSTDTQLAAARKLLDVRRQAVGDGSTRQIFNSFLIHRVSDGKQLAIDATALTPVEPGDIVEVLFLGASRQAGLDGPAVGAAPAKRAALAAPAGPQQREQVRPVDGSTGPSAIAPATASAMSRSGPSDADATEAALVNTPSVAEISAQAPSNDLRTGPTRVPAVSPPEISSEGGQPGMRRVRSDTGRIKPLGHFRNE